MAKSPQEVNAEMIAGLKEKTVKAMEDWLKIVRSSGLSTYDEVMKLLKEKDALISDVPDVLVETQYAGAKAVLRPLYDKLIKAITGFGKDIEVSPKKAYVSIRRSKQFAIIQPSTATRLDVGINLKGTKPTGRLEASGSFNAMVTHRVRVATIDEVDTELLGWLKQAYEAA
jgi:predicted transport protein